jgi:aerotaxis receptor
MRTNLPITEHELHFHVQENLVSVTDVDGYITYCNPAFIAVSGFTEEELLGQPHNIIRHPDMPQEAFRDLWDTIHSGLPWTGLVKNRCKNGDFYWVQANITPLRSGTQVTGYLSVRTVPSPEQVQQAQALYASMLADERTGAQRYRLHEGQVLRTGWRGHVSRWLHPSTSARLTWLHVAGAAIVALPAVLQAPLAMTAVSAATAVLITSWLARRWAVAPLAALVSDANWLASGDLSHPVTTGDSGNVGQLQRALFQLSVNLRTVVHDVRDEVRQLEQSVQEVAEGNRSLFDRTQTQANNLAVTASAMEEITSTVHSSAASAAQGAQLAAQTKTLTGSGHDAVEAAGHTMREIADASKDIQGIVHLIEGVAFQTNLLALNAAVEAARAGEQGRGFAVVASEVRTLATHTADAARSIRQLVGQASDRVANGSQATQVALQRMDDTLAAVAQVDALLAGINTATHEQQLGIAQINGAMAELENITQQNAALVEQVTASALALRNQAGNVRNTMSLLRLSSTEQSLTTSPRRATGQQTWR